MTDFVIDHTAVDSYNSQDAYAEETLREMLDKASIQINTLEREVERLNFNFTNANQRANEAEQKIDNVKGYIADMVSAGDTITSEIKDIAELLEIELTKTISGTATFEISWSAQVPLDFEADDFEISFDANCESYEADDFEWMEESSEVNAEDDY